MSLVLRHACEQFPDAGWPRDDANFVAISGSVVIGSIKRLSGGPSGGQWMWSITVLHRAPKEGPTHGAAPSKEEAMAAFAETWRGWLDQAGLIEQTAIDK